MRLLTWNINALVRANSYLKLFEQSWCTVPGLLPDCDQKLHMHVPQAGTVRNFELKHGSFRGFLDAYHIDILSVQVSRPQTTIHVAAHMSAAVTSPLSPPAADIEKVMRLAGA